MNETTLLISVVTVVITILGTGVALGVVIQTGINRLRLEVVEIKQDFRDLRTEFGELRTEFGELRKEFGELRTDHGERLARIEGMLTPRPFQQVGGEPGAVTT